MKASIRCENFCGKKDLKVKCEMLEIGNIFNSNFPQLFKYHVNFLPSTTHRLSNIFPKTIVHKTKCSRWQEKVISPIIYY